MKIKIEELKEISRKALKRIGFIGKDVETILNHTITAELEGKKSHGVVRIVKLKNPVVSKEVGLTEDDPEITKETPVSLHVDGKSKTGLVVVEWALDKAIEKAKTNMVCFVGTKNVGPVTGMIGYFAKKAAKENLIFLGFNNSPAGLTPFGSKESLWGTNPFTVGIPTNNTELPIILDMASSKMTFGDVMIHKVLGKELPQGISVDSEGNPTTDPNKAVDGSQVPFEGRKGSGLAMIVEIFYPGEKSGKTYLSNLERGEIEVANNLIQDLKNI